MLRRRFGAALAAACVLLALPALAQEKRVALVIGNAAYKEAPLRNPVNDARAMAAALRKLGFDVIARENATRDQLGRAIVEFGGRLDASSAALVFYAGHGIQSRGRNYLIPVDAALNAESDLRYQAVDVTGLLEEIEQAQSRVGFVILDACRNNPFERRLRGAAQASGLAAIDAARGLMIAYATSPGSVAADGDGSNGVYTAALLKALAQPGLKAEEVFKRVRIEVTGATANRQTPWESSSLTGDFVFNVTVNVAPVVAAAGTADREALFWQSAQAGNRTEEYEAYLKQYPQGAFAALAQSRIAALKAQLPQQAMVAPAPAAPAPRPGGAAPRDCAECPEMVAIPGGTFTMGSPQGEAGRDDDEGPLHSVSVGSFSLGKYEVTRDQFAAFVRDSGDAAGGDCHGHIGVKWEKSAGRDWRSPGFAQSGRDPVVCVSWDDAKAYVAWLSRKTGTTYRLPSEAEWEYAARARSATARFWGEDARNACRYGNVADRTVKRTYPGWTVHECDDGQTYTAPAGRYHANAFGLHDVLGNVWEWAEDCWNDSHDGSPRDGGARLSGDCGSRVIRGGSWLNMPRLVRSADRFKFDTAYRGTNLGFRVARTD